MAKNLVPNPDFEAGVTGWVDSSAELTVNILASTTAWKRSGAKALEYKATNLSGFTKDGGVMQPTGLSAPMAVAAGKSYTFNVIANLLDIGGGTGVELNILWYTAAGAVISTSTSATKVTTLGEQVMSLTATAPALATLASVRVRIKGILNNGIGWYMLDNIEFFDASEVSGEEKLICNGFNLNDLVATVMESLSFTPAQLRAKLAENSNTSGVLLVEEPQFTPAYFEAQIRIVTKTTMDEALETVGKLIDALQGCAKTEDGAALEWTPNTTTTTYTAYALMAELAEVPITPDGELAGWFLRSPVLKIKITCRPFLYKEERQVLASTVSTSPTQVVYVGGIEGDVPAEARMVINNKVAQGMRFAEWGMDVVASETNPTLVYEGTVGLKYTGFIGESSTKAGSKSTNVVKAKLSTIPAAICTTGTIEHVGDFEAKLRVYVSTTSYEQARVVFRVSYRTGNGAWTSRDWVEVPTTNEWVEMDLREIFLEEVEKGNQVSEIRVEGRNLEQQSTAYVDLLTLIPAKRRAVARSEAKFDIPTVMKAADTMAQSAGNATGKTMDVGGAYAVFAGSDTTDFTIGEGKLKRTAVSDTGTIYSKGRAIGPSANFSGNLAARLDFNIETSSSFSSNPYFGLMLSYASETSFILVFLNFAGGSGNNWYCSTVNGKVEFPGSGSGFVDSLGGSATRVNGSLVCVIEGERLTIWIAGEDGVYRRHASVVDEKSKQIGVAGRVGIYDSNQTANASTREYDNFAVWTPELPTVCEPSKALEIGSDGAIRQDSTGSYYTPPPEYRGGDLYLEPAGKAGVVNRIANKMRRNDTRLEADENITDERSVEIFARERFLAPR